MLPSLSDLLSNFMLTLPFDEGHEEEIAVQQGPQNADGRMHAALSRSEGHNRLRGNPMSFAEMSVDREQNSLGSTAPRKGTRASRRAAQR